MITIANIFRVTPSLLTALVVLHFILAASPVCRPPSDCEWLQRSEIITMTRDDRTGVLLFIEHCRWKNVPDNAPQEVPGRNAGTPTTTFGIDLIVVGRRLLTIRL